MPWMYFNSEKAFNFLKQYGIVYTLRPAGRRMPAKKMVVDIRHHSKKTEFKATRFYVRDVLIEIPSMIANFAGMSGFDSLNEWIEEAKRISGAHKVWRLFMVKKINQEQKEENKNELHTD